MEQVTGKSVVCIRKNKEGQADEGKKCAFL